MAKKHDRGRAGRNRTLVVTKEEQIRLSGKLMRITSDQKPGRFDIIDKTILGDLFSIIDCIPDEMADLIVIDPPYNLTKDYNGLRFKSLGNAEYLEYLRSWFPKVVAKLKVCGSLYICGDWRCTAALQQVMEENLTVLNRITWQREKGRGALSNWKNGMEDIWFGVKNQKSYYFDVNAVKMKRKVLAPYRENGSPKDWEETDSGNFRLTFPSNFWDDITVPYWSMPENTDHPTQKPEKLIARLILASCPPNGLVFDPFLGSGTTSVVAKKLGRRFCGIEMNEEYAIWAEKRLEKAEADRSIQGFADGVFWERNSLSFQKKSEKQKQ
ncbi:MAG: site-specific DNA-methyltransferase [Bacteroidetes bacterium]|nr:site-specific DNA-methyltransferase [Bacteroidota bacterium]MBU1720644.1 site-specific DNA-methyltransferase [Bacteroidota bacterium]